MSRNQWRHRSAHLRDLVVVDGVTHPGIDPLDDVTAERLEDARRHFHALERDVRIHIAAAKDNARACKRAYVGARRAFRADQPCAQADDGTIAPGIARREFKRQTPALREAEQHDPSGPKPLWARSSTSPPTWASARER